MYNRPKRDWAWAPIQNLNVLWSSLYLSPLDGDAVGAHDDLMRAAGAAARALKARVHGVLRSHGRLSGGVGRQGAVLMLGGPAGYRACARHVCNKEENISELVVCFLI